MITMARSNAHLPQTTTRTSRLTPAKALVWVILLLPKTPPLEPLTTLASAPPEAPLFGKNPNGTAETADRAQSRSTAGFMVRAAGDVIRFRE